MAQLHLYVPDRLASILRKRAHSHGTSLSRYLAELVSRDLREDWPDGFFEEVIGGWKGELLDRPSQGSLEAREAL